MANSSSLVPSKAILRASRVAAAIKGAGEFGIDVPGGMTCDFAQVMERMRRLRAGISVHDSAERFRSLGVDVFFGQARFIDGGQAIEVADQRLQFKKAAICTGARAAIPPIPGHAEHVWEDCAIEIGQSGKMGPATINPQTGKPYTYGDQWAARYELIRREIVRRFAAGYTIWFMPP